MNFGSQIIDQWITLRSLRMVFTLLMILCVVSWFAGCNHHEKQQIQFTQDCGPCQTMLQQIEYPDLECDQDGDGFELLTGPPMTISSFQDLKPMELTVEECVELALANSKVMQKLGGVVINSPQGVTTLYDQAIVETSGGSVEAALSAYDAQLNSSFFYDRNEFFVNNPLFGGGVQNASRFQLEVAKQTASGASLALRNLTDYNRRENPFTTLDSIYNMVTQVELRQPIGRGRGTTVNRIAGPNAVPGVYNGVLIARIRSDISLADFEAAVRNLVRDVENTYWELYFSYRNFDTKLNARELARKVWKNRKLRLDNEVGRPDDEAIARQQYYSFQSQAQNVLTGIPGQPGILGSDRNLRRLMGMLANDGVIIRPISDPALAPVTFDWEQSQIETLTRRVEIRRQKWTVRQRELELIAAKSLNRWRFDLVGQYGFRGFGDDLLGTSPTPDGGAFNDMINGNLDDWQLGLELGGAIGNRTGHLAIRNAELSLVRERTLLKEQQRQVLLDLNEAFTEVDRAMASLKTNFDARIAAQDEVIPKRDRERVGQDQVFFLLDAEQRAANTESAVHRSVADYNKALLNYVYTTGTLLSRYNIQLTEGAWTGDAQENMIRKAPRFIKRGPNLCETDTSPVSMGGYDQTAQRLGTDFPADNANPSMAPANPAESVDPQADVPQQLNNQFIEERQGSEPSQTPGSDDGAFSMPKFNFNVPAATTQKYYESQANRN